MDNEELKANEVKLRDGRIVEIRELSALEDSLAYRLAGPELAKDNNQILSGLTVRATQVAASLAKIDGKDCPPIRSLEEVFNMQAKFGKKDWAKISDKYFEVNEAEDEGE